MKTDFLKLPSDGNIYSFETKNDSFSYSLYKESLEKFKSIFRNIYRVEDNQVGSRIIGILGNRGSGKTSFLKNAVNKLKNEENLRTIILEPIDPSIMDDQLNILELIVSKLATKVENEKKRRIKNEDMFHSIDSFEYKLDNFYEHLEKVNKVLSSLRIDRGDLAKGLSSTSFTEDLKNKVGFIEQINFLIDSFVSLNGEKNTKVVCVIDDLDLISNKYIVKEVEMLSKFISYTKLILILAYRPKQLENTLLAEKISENKILLEKNIISVEELEDRVNNQLSKLIPHNCQVLLPEQSVVMEKTMYDYLKDFLIEGRNLEEVKNLLTCIDLSDKQNQNYENISVKNWINKAVFNATGITFEPTKKNEFYDNFLTKNLRDLIQFLEVIFDMDTIEKNSDNYHVELNKVVNKKLKNIEKFESYINLMSKKVLPSNLIDVYEKIKNSDVKEHNYIVYREMINLLDKLENEDAKNSTDTYKNNTFESVILKINYSSAENVSLGDVINIIDVLEFSYQRFIEINDVYKLIYFIKISYSILLMRNLLQTIVEEKNERKPTVSENNYVLLLNGKITTSFINYNKGFKKTFVWPNIKNMSNTEKGIVVPLEKYILPYMVYTNRSSMGSQTREVLSTKDSTPTLFNRRYFINKVTRDKSEISTYWALSSFGSPFAMTMVAGRNYNLDPLAYLTHQDYIDKQIENAKKIFNNTTDDKQTLGYLVTDIFQLDLINAYNYANDATDKWYTLGRINDYLSSNMVNRESTILADCFQTLFSYDSEKFVYVTPYNKERIKRRMEEKENIESNDLEKIFEGVIDLLNNVNSEAEKRIFKNIIDKISKKGISFSDKKEQLQKLAPSQYEGDKEIYDDLTKSDRKRINQSRIEQNDVQDMLNRASLRDRME